MARVRADQASSDTKITTFPNFSPLCSGHLLISFPPLIPGLISCSSVAGGFKHLVQVREARRQQSDMQQGALPGALQPKSLITCCGGRLHGLLLLLLSRHASMLYKGGTCAVQAPPVSSRGGFSVPAASRTAASQGGFFPPNLSKLPVYRPKRQCIGSNFDRGWEELILPSPFRAFKSLFQNFDTNMSIFERAVPQRQTTRI